MGEKRFEIEIKMMDNLPKSEYAKAPKCPEEKEKAIIDALKHFEMF